MKSIARKGVLQSETYQYTNGLQLYFFSLKNILVNKKKGYLQAIKLNIGIKVREIKG